jgi:class 3 adenylate cyclase
MGTELRKLLDNAKGTTEHVVAIVIDIRGFTPFCKEEESVNAANFLKRVYTRIIDDYFPKASFYKPTGDGLLIVIPYTQDSLKDTVANVMRYCQSLLQDFGKLCEGDDMIYFQTPDKVGIGISRGAACCISSGETIIDYSGRVINLAARLNDFARPSGIVFDSSLGLTLLSNDMQELFLRDNVYVRGIAEGKPITIYFTKSYTLIPDSRKHPLNEPELVEEATEDLALGKAKEFLASGITYYGIGLERMPSDENRITIELVVHGDIEKVRFVDIRSLGITTKTTGKKYYIGVPYAYIVEELHKIGARDDSIFAFTITYPAAPKSP